MYHNILIVCLGNICRSPTAERIMQKKLPGHRISSAGIKALAGKDADFQAIKTALKHGVIVAGHTARQTDCPNVRTGRFDSRHGALSNRHGGRHPSAGTQQNHAVCPMVA